MGEEWKPSAALLELVELAFNHAAESVCEGETLVPFVLCDRGGHVSIERCMVMVRGKSGVGGEDGWDAGPSAEEAKAKARASGRASGGAEGATRAIAAYDGYLRKRDGTRLDAIVVEAYEDGAPVALMMAQAYQPPTEEEAFCLVNDPLSLGLIERMW
jgi:hypothetical protein